ncbi:hypothetical protein Ddye_006618 [Dipteronia dyeriana]|uniref:Transmembrane protein n=1 Tax=Dipteronia dyeriana TaxID=168575 RepID=A0AAE0CQQ0_9ROSI|nr:hypothetical protein Ddye_006618 [Dipteronia dyeriana]
MIMLCQAPLTTRKCSLNLKLANPNPPLFTTKCNPTTKYIPRSRRSSSKSRPRIHLTIAKAEGGVDSTKQASSSASFNNEETVFVTQENVPLEGVIQFEKPDFSSRINKWGRVALLSGGDVLALFLFSAIGRFNHGFSVFDIETLRTADPFIAGWFLSAYFLGGYAEDGRGMNGLSKAVIAAAKSWALGIPLGLVIRAVTSGHIPPYAFILVTMGSTAVLLIGWRALLFSFLPGDKIKKNDVYRRGNPFELFELLTSLVRRW